MNTAEIKNLYDAGNTELIAVMNDGTTQKLRLFISTMGDICYLAKGKQNRGYPVSHIIRNIESVNLPKKQNKDELEKYIDNIRKFKKAYTENLHPNLWPKLRDGYSRFDIDEFKKFVNKNGYDNEFSSHNTLWHNLCRFCSNHSLDIITENRYKSTTIKGNPPKGNNGWWHDRSSDYELCITNIKKHLDNKEDFRYHWRGNYDVSVSGKLLEDGEYQAWFSLEYRNCGNGHYYLLINENQAIFCEDD